MMSFYRSMKSACLAATLFVSTSASAATLLTDVNGDLTGATGVIVQGTSYDVSFLDGTCASLFSGCDSVSDFAFADRFLAALASEALLGQVFLDSSLGSFDSRPYLTRGCDDVLQCRVITPYALTSGGFTGSFADNLGTFDSVGTTINGSSFATSQNPTVTFAVFTPSLTAAVPEPSTWAMMLVGFGFVGCGIRAAKRRQKPAVSFV